jgi:hypothetical protein
MSFASMQPHVVSNAVCCTTGLAHDCDSFASCLADSMHLAVTLLIASRKLRVLDRG